VFSVAQDGSEDHEALDERHIKRKITSEDGALVTLRILHSASPTDGPTPQPTGPDHARG
jgi:hypothetical protein